MNACRGAQGGRRATPGVRCRSLAVLAALLCVACGAPAAVYRCGNAYTEVPCPEAAKLEVDDRRSDADRAAALEVARRESALAARMTADREQAEAALLAARPRWTARPAVAVTAPLAKKKRVVRLRPQEDADGNFVAYVPAKRATKP